MMVGAPLLAALLLCTVPSWAGPLLVVPIGPGGKFHPGSKADPDLVWGKAMHTGSMIAGTSRFQILKAGMWFNSEVFSSGRHSFFGPGQELFLYGSIDLDHDGGHRDRKDVWGVLIAAKFLNYRFVERHGQTFFIANLLETINPKLAALLGLHQTTYHATLELQLLQIRSGKQVYDLIERGVLTTGSIPEPPSILLLGVPPLWLGARRWLRRSSLPPTSSIFPGIPETPAASN